MVKTSTHLFYVLFVLEFLTSKCHQNTTNVIKFLIDGASPSSKDDYWCTYMEIKKEQYITFLEVVSEINRAHHIILMACSSIGGAKMGLCNDAAYCSGSKIMFAWAHNAPPKTLPDNVGFRIGDDSARYLMLQIHYADPISAGQKDYSGLELHTSFHKPKYIAGVYLMVGGGPQIPPNEISFNIDIACKVRVNAPLHLFAYRTHAHGLGRVITGYVYNEKNHNFLPIVKGNPQWPQAFYPFHSNFTLKNGDVLVARCNYDSSKRNRTTYIGSTSNDEMCNLYLMYYTEADQGISYYACSGGEGLPIPLPPDSTVGLPNNTKLDQISAGVLHLKHGESIEVPNVDNPGFITRRTGLLYDELYEPFNARSWNEDGVTGYYAVANWPSVSYTFGQITGVSEDLDGNIVLFHRGPRVWNSFTFNINNMLRDKNKGPIDTNTVITLDRNTGRILHEWGKDLFFLPHGLTIDRFGWIYLTDVGTHQVFRYHPRGQFNKADLTLGEKFVPGSSNNQFCKPTSVAVAHNGDFFVADGYCNSRLVQFNAKGEFKASMGHSNKIGLSRPSIGEFSIPHKVIDIPDKGHTCVADRDNRRIQCFDLTNHKASFFKDDFDGGLYSISYTPARGGLLFAITGINSSSGPKGYIYQYDSGELLSTFSPNGHFSNPHDVHVVFNGSALYVVEIGPNKIWKFVQEFGENNFSTTATTSIMSSSEKHESVSISTVFPSTEKPVMPMLHTSHVGRTAGIVSGILALPTFMCIALIIYIRSRRKDRAGKVASANKKVFESQRNQSSWKKFRLDNLLDPKHKGFEILRTEEDDVDVRDSSSESEIDFQLEPSKA